MSYACSFQLMIYLSLFFLCSDVALVTSLRDGMNLVSYEFVACQDAKKGVLILSEVITKLAEFGYAQSSSFFFPIKDKL